MYWNIEISSRPDYIEVHIGPSLYDGYKKYNLSSEKNGIMKEIKLTVGLEPAPQGVALSMLTDCTRKHLPCSTDAEEFKVSIGRGRELLPWCNRLALWARRPKMRVWGFKVRVSPGANFFPLCWKVYNFGYNRVFCPLKQNLMVVYPIGNVLEGQNVITVVPGCAFMLMAANGRINKQNCLKTR